MPFPLFSMVCCLGLYNVSLSSPAYCAGADAEAAPEVKPEPQKAEEKARITLKREAVVPLGPTCQVLNQRTAHQR